MMAWEDRPVEIANLLNPPFCGEVLRQTFSSYSNETSSPFRYILAFLILPIVLHEETRASISPRQRQPLHTWIQENQHLKVGFAERTRQLIPITKEALTFLLQIQAVTIDEQAGLSTTRSRKRVLNQEDSEVADCFKKAQIVGRWFARAGDPITIYALWGVRP